MDHEAGEGFGGIERARSAEVGGDFKIKPSGFQAFGEFLPMLRRGEDDGRIAGHEGCADQFVRESRRKCLLRRSGRSECGGVVAAAEVAWGWTHCRSGKYSHSCSDSPRDTQDSKYVSKYSSANKSKSQPLQKTQTVRCGVNLRGRWNAGNCCYGVVCEVSRARGQVLRIAQRPLVAGNVGVDGARPGVDAASEGLGVGEALVA
jgi:hypothetical protein